MFKKIIVFAIVFGVVVGLTGFVKSYFFGETVTGQITLIANSTDPAKKAEFYDSNNMPLESIAFSNISEAETTCERFKIENTGRVAITGTFIGEAVTRSFLCGGTATSSGVVYDWGIPSSNATITPDGLCRVIPELEVSEVVFYDLCLYYPLQDDTGEINAVIDVSASFGFE